MTILDELYESEINCRIWSEWDSGWTAELGDQYNGFVETKCGLSTFAEVVVWLTEAALRYFPESSFARRRATSLR